MPLRAIVFDFDGVIANTEPLHFAAYRDVLKEVGVDLTTDAYYTRYLGYDDLGAFRAIGADYRRLFSAEELQSLLERKAARMEQLERESDVLFPGAAAAVRRLAAALPLGVASGALRPEIVRVLDATRLAGFFAVIVAAGETRSSKPAPDPYLRAVDLLRAWAAIPDLAPADCLAIEDSRWGLESARSAGLRTIAVTHTYDAAALAGSADRVIASLDALDPDELIQSFGSAAGPNR